MESIFWLFPVIFMLHEMEEIIGFKLWLDKNTDIIKIYPGLPKLYQNFSNEGFSTAVLEEYLLCIIITSLGIYFDIYIVWIGAFIVFSLHLLVHIIQSIVIKRYIPSLVSSILLLPVSIFLIFKTIQHFRYTFYSVLISSVLCLILMLLNLSLIHWIMKKVTEKIKKQNNMNY